MATDLSADWEYCHLGPADSFVGLLGDLKVKTSEGWELAGVTNEASKVYATVKRPLGAPVGTQRRVA